MNKRGSVPILVSAAIPTILLSGFFAIDATRLWLHKARLQAAADAGALIAARDINDPKRDANVKASVTSTYNGNSPSSTPMTAANVSIVPIGEDRISVGANATFTSIMSGVTGVNGWGTWQPQRVISVESSANRTNNGLELALVFDITLSMVQSDGTGSGSNRIQSARDAALTMLATLYGDDPAQPAQKKKWLENLFISVVPFNVTVNYGSANTHFLSAAPPASDYPASWSGATGWGGCAEMRPVSLGDATPNGAATGLRRYYWPSTYKTSERHDSNRTNNTANQTYCLSTAAYSDTRKDNPSGSHNVCMGHNDWTGPAYQLTNKKNRFLLALEGNSLVDAANLDVWATAHGPNMMCPPESATQARNQAVLPLTRDRATIETRIRALANLPFSYGTNFAAGLQAGWFTLSPNWRNRNGFAGWPSTEPPDVASDPRPTLPALPLDYHTARMSKVMILLTDGDNLWYNAREIQGDGNTLVRPESRRVEAFYGAYGKLGPDYANDDRLVVDIPSNPSNLATASDTALAAAAGEIDSAAVEWCEKIRTRAAPTRAGGEPGPEQITIYTIGFGANIGSRATNALRSCASRRPDGTALYYPAPTAAELKSIFKSIGNDLSTLRLVQ